MNPKTALTRQLLLAPLLLVALIACGGVDDGTGTGTASVIVRWSGTDGDADPSTAAPNSDTASSIEPALAPSGVPTDPTGTTEGVTEVELFVTSGGEQLQFDAGGNVVESGGQPTYLTTGSVTLQLPHGTYDFETEGSDPNNNLLADGELTNVVITEDVSITVDLQSHIGSATLETPQVVVPNQIADIELLVHPPGRADLVVPSNDFEVVYRTSAEVVSTSKRGLRLMVDCEPINVQVDVTDHRLPPTIINIDANIPAADICDTYKGPIGVDLIPPTVAYDMPPSGVPVGHPFTLTGTSSDAQSGTESIRIFDGPIWLGDATLDTRGISVIWHFTFTPIESRSYNLTIVGRDIAGNETRKAITVNPTEPSELRFQTVSASNLAHTCALTTKGQAYCWGANASGQLGDASFISRDVPTMVVGGHTFVYIATGRTHSCAIDDSNTAYCWGLNGTTSLGNAPIPVTGTLKFRIITTGSGHTCGITTDNAAYCWGRNEHGQLGDGTNSNRSYPVPVTGLYTFQSVTAGSDHTCGATTTGATYCWGRNDHGQLGNGTTDDSPTPRLVPGGNLFESIAAGGYHTCGATTTGIVNCWGSNDRGQIGDGTTTDRTIPAPVTGGLAYVAIAAGYGHTCGITISSVTQCWGYNNTGQLGIGTTARPNTSPTPLPTLVVGGHNFARITTGYNHSCGVTSSSSIYCWGINAQGSIGDGTTTLRRAPSPILLPMATP